MQALRASRRCPSRTWVLLILVLLMSPAVVRGQAAAERRQPAGKLQSPAGSLLERAAQAPQPAVSKGDVSSGDQLLALPGERAEILSPGGAVQLSLWANLPELYDFPVLETAVVLHADPARDLDFTLELGRVVLTQQRLKKTADVRVIHQKNVYDFILSEPGTQLAIEAFGRWPSGAPFLKGPRTERSEDVPTQVFLAYTIKGTASLKIGNEQYLMPSLASFRWDNVVGRDQLPKRNSKLPTWADEPAAKPETRTMQAAVERFRGLVAKGGPDKAIREALNGNEPEVRRVAVFSLGALDDLPGLVDALSNPRLPDVRGAALPALQHWIGKGPASDLQLYNFLIKDRQFTPNQAEIVMHLLHGFRENDRGRPETLETMIEYLRHSKLPIRELASSYLNRWIPKGRDILYDAGGSAAQIEQGYKAWKKLVPDGKLPAGTGAK